MKPSKSPEELIFSILKNSNKEELTFQYTDDVPINGTQIQINNKPHINFSSCSYLALESHQSVVEGAIKAIEKYGSQFSSTRSYLSIGLYKEWESLMSQVFGNKNLMLTTSVSAAHLIAMPSLISPNDLLIFDHQSHYSMQWVANHMATLGTKIKRIQHSDLNKLEEILHEVGDNFSKVYYVVDGVFSMFGDFAPLKELIEMQARFPNLHLYIDDAHGMSWTGKNGCGYSLSQIELNKKMIFITSLNKAFAAGGGIIVVPGQAELERLKFMGNHFLFSGPLQPGSVGAGVASSNIHLSAEIFQLQNQFEDRLLFCNQLISENNIPMASADAGPIFFVAVGKIQAAKELVTRMKEDGFYTNVASFPVVPIDQSGLRFTLNVKHDYNEITKFLNSIKKNYNIVLKNHDTTIEDVNEAFKTVPNYMQINV